MKNIKNKIVSVLFLAAFVVTGCEFGDINTDPSRVKAAPIAQQLTSLTVNVGFLAGSDLNRYSSLIMQQYSGQSVGATTQTQFFEQFQIIGPDLNNLWSNMYAVILNDAENIIVDATATNSPHYSGVAKILKAYTYQLAVDTWGKIPYSETQKLSANVKPKYDSDELIYTELITLLDQGIAEVNAPTSAISPGTNSSIYPGAFSASRNNWVRFANTLKLRIFLHYSEKDAAFAKSRMDALISSGAPLMIGNADSFQMNFLDAANARNPIDQFETLRLGNLVANARIVNMMNSKTDPRRQFYFTQFPANSGLYVGSVAGAPANPGIYSRFHTYLRGAITGVTYTGAAPIRMLTFAEYNFIRAEASLRFASPGSAQTFYQAGIRASMESAGVVAADITAYLAANGALTGTNAQQLEQIINEKYIAGYGVVLEPWTDFRRTGFPSLTLPSNAVIPFFPRSLFYPQSEIDLNPENATQKTGMNVKVFWDTRP
ncbi:Starch-binding associating with outer membrane [Flavobacterium micromati]|uniref:Starch-binding associating with outer membrane n=1 Tax=Flavobacterium micromati TaxID=229205 RepID=A0A1M5KA63_9FLAO|nr:SusD/RagB family nutrient-binding outer membrane lipoprotein [Flavobacterium micromati]SHG49677.1 Starch-binding associating with outer membrane [Flavobacterium micromati]